MRMIWGYRLIAVVGALHLLSGGAPPDKRVIEACRVTAILEGKGHQLISSDIGELTEACMASKGFALRETGKRCSDDLATAINPGCYYRDNFIGRLAAMVD